MFDAIPFEGPRTFRATDPVQTVYRALRACILEGGLAPGAALTIRGVAEELGTSMTPGLMTARYRIAARCWTSKRWRKLSPILREPCVRTYLSNRRST